MEVLGSEQLIFQFCVPRTFGYRLAMAERPCTCTGCAEANSDCGLKLLPGRQTCGNNMKKKGMAYHFGVCTSCLCRRCYVYPCDCPEIDIPSGGSIVPHPSSGGTGRASSCCQASVHGRGGGTWTCQAWPSSHQWLISGSQAAGVSDAAMQLIQDLQDRIAALEHEIMMMKEAKDPQQ